ncbi:unnamed protein product, partial [Closterium sp. Naga37s-1]
HLSTSHGPPVHSTPHNPPKYSSSIRVLPMVSTDTRDKFRAAALTGIWGQGHGAGKEGSRAGLPRDGGRVALAVV